MDTVNLDTSYQLQNLPFTNVPEFFVQSVHGVSFLKQPSDYKITLDALNLGIQSDRRSEISVLLDQKPLTITTPDQSALNRAVITLPNSALAPYFQEDHLRTVPLVIRVTMTRIGLLQEFLHNSKTYEIPVTLTLYPNLAATIALEVHYPHYDWVPIGQVPGDISAPTPNKDGCQHWESGCAFESTVEVKVHSSQTTPPTQGDQRIEAYTLECVNGGGPCGCTRAASTNLIEHESHAIIKYQTWSGPVQMQARATAVSEYRRRAQDDTMTLSMNIYFDLRPHHAGCSTG